VSLRKAHVFRGEGSAGKRIDASRIVPVIKANGRCAAITSQQEGGLFQDRNELKIRIFLELINAVSYMKRPWCLAIGI
jgi:hypothetical protein